MSDANTHELSAPDRTVEHDEFDPLGTLSLIVLYFLSLVLLWLFTYFIEFLGNDPTPLVIV
ncbi:cytochrome oxidase [Natronolimnohabitans sp. A-GB9]|uniref:cytochrome oxidase n=1 Tax=Natronolimnohabitans sp. A-GB9 TaxID=3069757 RepID=UPI0027B7D2C3|nr:cytochrome oxidase [Natronolimnohabitans sp. A-GB9]MDQ2049823.1 cytochrome oxidase [Natronolimnohabitans sp. A-GB9]